MKLMKNPLTDEKVLIADEEAEFYPGWEEQVQEDCDLIQLNVRKDALRSATIQQLALCFEAGFSPTRGPLLGHTLQTREEDKSNWLTSQAAYSSAVAAGAGALPGATFRTKSNVTIGCTYREGLDTLLDMASWGQSVMARSWVLKDSIASATTAAALDDIHPEEGWP